MSDEETKAEFAAKSMEHIKEAEKLLIDLQNELNDKRLPIVLLFDGMKKELMHARLNIRLIGEL